MKIKKVKNFSNNMIYGLIYRFISLLFPFFIRTAIIRVLSSEYLGLNSLFTSILQALNLFELGIGSALVFNMYKPIAENDTQKICAYLKFYKKCYRIIGAIILISGLVVLPFIKNFINGSYPSDINIYYVYLIFLLNTVLTYWLFAYKNSIALAHQRTDIENKALIISNFSMYVFQLIILFIYKNYYLYIILLPLFTIVKNIIVYYSVKKNFPQYVLSGELARDEKNKLKSNVKCLFGHQIAFTVINSADSIVISMILGLNDLAIYNNYYYIFLALVSILNIVFSSIQAGIGNDVLTSNSDEVYSKFLKFRSFVFALVSLFSVCLFALYQPFMKIWMGEKYLINDSYIYIFSIGFFITQTRRVITTYKNAIGMWKEDVLKPYIVIVADLIIDFILINHIGVIGAMISTILSMFFIAIPWETNILFKKLFNKRPVGYYLYYIKEFIIMIILIGIINIVLSFYEISGIVGILATFMYSLILFSCVYFITHINDKNLLWIFKRGFNFVRFRK